MATWITHLRLAENLLERIAGLEAASFAVGNVTPDSGIPDEKWETFTPPPQVSHFATAEDSRGPLADLTFYRRYLQPPEETDNSTRFSFLLGYFFHLVTDNLWRERIYLPTRDRFAAQFEADPEFIWQIKRDWYGLDLAYVRTRPDSLFWRVFLDCGYTEDYLEFMPPEAVQQRLDYIKTLYQRTDDEIEEWYGNRPDRYLSTEEMDRFVEQATGRLDELYRVLWDEETDVSGFISTLDLPGWSPTDEKK